MSPLDDQFLQKYLKSITEDQLLQEFLNVLFFIAKPHFLYLSYNEKLQLLAFCQSIIRSDNFNSEVGDE